MRIELWPAAKEAIATARMVCDLEAGITTVPLSLDFCVIIFTATFSLFSVVSASETRFFTKSSWRAKEFFTLRQFLYTCLAGRKRHLTTQKAKKTMNILRILLKQQALLLYYILKGKNTSIGKKFLWVVLGWNYRLKTGERRAK